MNEQTSETKKGSRVNKFFWPIVSALIIGFLSGVGSFQMMIAGEVKSHGTELAYLKEQGKADRAFFEQRIAGIVSLMEANAKQTSELVNLVRDQNNIAREQNRLIERYYLKQ